MAPSNRAIICVSRFTSGGRRTPLVPLVVFLLSILPATLYAGTFYVDFQRGNDLNPGVSAIKPWRHCPGDESYRGQKVLRAGDVVHFKRGVIYRGMIKTLSPSVSYTVTDWGSGDAVIDGSGFEACFRVAHDGVTITGGVGKHLKLTGKTVRHAAIWNWADQGLSGSSFSNLKIIEVGGPTSIEGIGIKIGGNQAAYKNHIISRNVISDCYSAGIKLSGSGTRDIDIRHNLLEGNGALPGERCQVNLSSNDGQGVQFVRFHGNIVRKGGSKANGVNCNNAGNEIYGNTITGNPGHGISLAVNYNKNYSGVTKVFSNTISRNAGGYGIIVGHSDDRRRVLVYNNVLVDNGWYELNFSDGASFNEVYNNTFYHGKPGHGIRVQRGCENNILNNNIILTNGGYAIHDSTGRLREDFNTFYRDSGGPVMVWKDRICTNIEQYRDESGQGKHSFSENPLFADASSLQLMPDSPCRGTGTNLSPVFSVDKDGVVRPKSGGWDRGAHQSGGYR